MKPIKTFTRYKKIRDVYKALEKAGFHSMTFVECERTDEEGILVI